MQLSHNDELIDLNEAIEIEHINYLKEFQQKVYPLYAKYVGFGEAMILWKLNCIHNAIRELIDERPC